MNVSFIYSGVRVKYITHTFKKFLNLGLMKMTDHFVSFF